MRTLKNRLYWIWLNKNSFIWCTLIYYAFLVKCSLETDGNSGHLWLSLLKLPILEYCLGMLFLWSTPNSNLLTDDKTGTQSQCTETNIHVLRDCVVKTKFFQWGNFLTVLLRVLGAVCQWLEWAAFTTESPE